MKLLDKKKSSGYAKIELTSPDDTWFLFRILRPGDTVRGKITRKIKIGSDTVKKTLTTSLRVERCEYLGDTIRILGVTIEESEDIPKGAHQSISLGVEDIFSIVKDGWTTFEETLLEDAIKNKGHTILLLVLDRDSALFATTSRNGYHIIASLRGDVAKKRVGVIGKEFFPIVIKKLQELLTLHPSDAILVASPGFWKDEFAKVLPSELKSKVHFATCSSDGEQGIIEVLKREEVKSLLRDVRISDELLIVDNFLREVHTGKRAAYGIVSVEQAVHAGAVATLLLSSKLLEKERAEGKTILDTLLKTAEKHRGKITLISSEHEGGKILDGLGGIGALLRYEM